MGHVENCREQARQHRGVWYDVRADKFVAEVYSKGDRHFLGHFDTAEAASEAYTAARVELPSGRDTGDTFVAAFQTFLDTAERNAKGEPARDEILTYKEQEFYFNGVVFRLLRGRKRPFFSWTSTCTCGAVYDTLTATSPAGAKGITRRCEQHRVGRRKAAPVATETASQDWVAVATEALDRLSLVSDSFGAAAFLAECKALRPDLPRAFGRFVINDDASPVVFRDEKLFPR